MKPETMLLSEQQARLLVQHAVAEAPQESCGLIAGQGHHVSQVIAVENIAADPTHFFEMDHHAFVRAIYEIERQGLSLLGIYHSHPKDLPIPSPQDTRNAFYPEVAYLIVSLRESAPRVAAWRIRAGEVEPIELKVGTAVDVHGFHKPANLTGAQKVAIVLSALLALILVITVSLALLPPVPALPR